MISENVAYLPEMIGVEPPGSIYTHIVGTDIVRTGENEIFVLEDNARTPSGVSYMLENRETMFEMFPDLFIRNRVRPVSTYPKRLRRSLEAHLYDTLQTRLNDPETGYPTDMARVIESHFQWATDGVGAIKAAATTANDFHPVHQLRRQELPGRAANRCRANSHTIYQQHGCVRGMAAHEYTGLFTKRPVLGNGRARL